MKTKKILSLLVIVIILTLGCIRLNRELPLSEYGQNTVPGQQQQQSGEVVTNPWVKSLECNVVNTSKNNETIMKMYIEEGKIRQETIGQVQLIMIMKGETAYIKANINNITDNRSDCDWWVYQNTGQNKTNASQLNYTSPEQKNYPANIKVKCSIGNFGEEVFDTPGKLCDSSELLLNQTNFTKVE